jgi:nucleotide-binding universal stress UspA family protein
MKTILVAVDGSDEAMKAARMAAELASKYQATLIVAHVREPLVYPAMESMFSSQRLHDELDKQARLLLAKTAEELKPSGVRIETHLAFGPPAAILADLAKTANVDLVVVGSHGRGAVARLLLGSVADRLVHTSAKPVLVVR